MTHKRTGRRDSVSAPEIASELAKHAHALRLAFQNGGDVGDPADLYSVAADLTHTAYRLQQAFDGMSRSLVTACERGDIRTDDGSDPAHRITEVGAALHEASAHALSLDAALGRTWGLLGTLATRDQQDAEEMW